MATPNERRFRREQMRKRRAEAKAAGIQLPCDTWAARNPEAHRERVARWRAARPIKSARIIRNNQAKRRSTPWGKINNSMWSLLHNGVRANSPAPGGKYAAALGYTWAALRKHLESLFQPGMDWDNWGTVWELDHIKPVRDFRYESIDCPTFRECWALTNMRPLWREANQRWRR